MSPFVVKAIQLLMSLSLLIVLHELGHFIPARLFKTRVEKFFLFFDVKFALFKKKIGETTYGIGWLPLGGYVKISGMIDESMDKEQMLQPPQPWEFRSKPAWQRLIIMLGGVTVNLILGFLIYMMILFVWGKYTLSSAELPLGMEPSPVVSQLGFEVGDQILTVDGKELENVMEINKYFLLRDVSEVALRRENGTKTTLSIPEDIGSQMFESGEMFPFTPVVPAVLDSVIPNSPASLAGLQSDDKILNLDGTPISNWTDFKNLMTKTSRTLQLVYERNRSIDTLSLTTSEDGTMGVYPKSNVSFKLETLTLSESIVEGFDYGYWTLRDYVAQFKYIFTSKGASQLGGFGAIGNMFPSQWNWKGFWSSTALISIILAFMNILPIPALDGGHVMFLFYEIVTGRKPNDKFMEYAQMFGFFLLLALVLYANGNDLFRAFFS
jgi:regulator of sigma E protease|tara:strand:- start:1006 stop:2319 length:1314 start_codon:yes stop_codon:yes gene_type:complete